MKKELVTEQVQSNGVPVFAVVTPFASAGELIYVPEGLNLRQIVEMIYLRSDLLLHVNVYLGEDFIPQDRWDKIYPKTNAQISIAVTPQGGGGGKNPLRTILQLAVIAAAAYFGPMLGAGVINAAYGGAMGAGITTTAGVILGVPVTAAALGGFIISAAGYLLVNALAPPSTGSFGGGDSSSSSQTLFIEGARNSGVRYGIVPVVLGRHKMVPLLAAQNITETVGNKQYVRQLFTWGYGNVSVYDRKIGETAIDQFKNVQMEDILDGTSESSTLDLYPADVYEEQLSAKLINPPLEGNEDGRATGYVGFYSNPNNGTAITLNNTTWNFSNSPGANTTVIQADLSGTLTQLVADLNASADNNINDATYTLNLSAGRVDIQFDLMGTAGNNYTLNVGSIDGYVSGTTLTGGLDSLPGSNEVVRTSQVDADELAIDITFPKGLVYLTTSGAHRATTVDFELKYRQTGTLVWSAPQTLSFTEASISAVRKTIILYVPREQYDVSITRITSDSTSDRRFDESYWSALRTITNENPVTFPGISLTALRIQATEQLNGSVDQFSAIVANNIPSWNGSTWQIAETSNPADIFRYVLANSWQFDGGAIGPNAQPLAEDRIDLASLQAWHDYCAAEGFEFNSVIDYETSVRGVLNQVAAAGRASVTIKDGKWSVIVDKPQPYVAQHFTPRNSWGYSCTKTYITRPHAFRCTFINEESNYLQDEYIVYDDGYNASNATITETIHFPGITKPSLIWKHARQHLATMRLQPRIHQFFSDVEHLIAPRGKRCKLTHDIINVGISQGRIKAITTSGTNVTHIEIDESITMEPSKNYGVVVRTGDNLELIKPVTNYVGPSNILQFVTPFDLIASHMEIGDLVIFGEAGRETIDIIIREIAPEQGFNVRISALDYNEAIYTASSGTIPDFTSGATYPKEFSRPVVPVLASPVQTAEEVQIINPDGSFSSRAVISLINNNVIPVTPEVFYRVSGTDTFFPAHIVSATPQQIVLQNLYMGNRYDFQVRYRSAAGATGLISNVLSPTLEINNVDYIGLSTIPPNIANFRSRVIGAMMVLEWDAPTVLDIDHYTIKFIPSIISGNWDSAALLADNIATTSYVTPTRTGTYFIKAFDRMGNQSADATVLINTIDSVGFNAVLNIVEDPLFLGTKINTSLALGVLEIIDTSLSGYYYFNDIVDLSEVYISRLTPHLIATGNNQSNTMDTWTTLSALTSLAGTTSSSWAAEIQVRFTDDDPNASPTWTAWQTLTVGDYSFRGAHFRIKLDSTIASVTPSVSEAGVLIDMPDRLERYEDQVIPINGLTININPAFKQLLDVQVTGQNMQQGDYWTVTDKTSSSVKITFYNSANSSVQRVADIQLAGYGRVQP